MNEQDRYLAAAYLSVTNLGWLKPKITGTVIYGENGHHGPLIDLTRLPYKKLSPYSLGLTLLWSLGGHQCETEEHESILHEEYESWAIGHLVNMSRAEISKTWPDTIAFFAAIDRSIEAETPATVFVDSAA